MGQSKTSVKSNICNVFARAHARYTTRMTHSWMEGAAPSPSSVSAVIGTNVGEQSGTHAQ